MSIKEASGDWQGPKSDDPSAWFPSGHLALPKILCAVTYCFCPPESKLYLKDKALNLYPTTSHPKESTQALADRVVQAWTARYPWREAASKHWTHATRSRISE